jgi:hypothetical protein
VSGLRAELELVVEMGFVGPADPGFIRRLVLERALACCSFPLVNCELEFRQS